MYSTLYSVHSVQYSTKASDEFEEYVNVTLGRSIQLPWRVITCSSLFSEYSLRYFVIDIRDSLFTCGGSLLERLTLA